MASGFFVAFAWLTMLTAMVITPAVSAGAIASERERRTIEYLFATDLSNAEIVLPKLVGKLLLVGKLVLVALPVLAIFRLLGGIPGNLLVLFFAGLASTVTLLTVGAMCISVWTPRARDAIIRVYLVEAVVFVLPLIMSGLMLGLGRLTGPGQWLSDRLADTVSLALEINPIHVLFNQMLRGGALGVGLEAGEMWRMVAIQLGLSVVLAALAVLAVRRVHLGAVSSPGSATAARRWELPRLRPGMGNRPMLWKELFANTATTKLGLLGRIAVLLLMIVTVGVAAYSYSVIIDQPTNNWQTPGETFASVSIMITTLIGVGIAILMGLRAAGLVTYEKERDCWLSLLSTPLDGADIVGAKALGNLYAFRWLLLPLAVVWLLQLTLSPVFLVAIPLHLLAIGTTGLFATAVGLAYSLKFTTSLKSIGATMITLFFVGGGYLLCCCMPVAVAGGDGEELFKIAMIGCVPFLQGVPGGIVFDDFFIDDEPWMAFDYVVGVILYGVAALVILSTLVCGLKNSQAAPPRPISAFPAVNTAPARSPLIRSIHLKRRQPRSRLQVKFTLLTNHRRIVGQRQQVRRHAGELHAPDATDFQQIILRTKRPTLVSGFDNPPRQHLAHFGQLSEFRPLGLIYIDEKFVRHRLRAIDLNQPPRQATFDDPRHYTNCQRHRGERRDSRLLTRLEEWLGHFDWSPGADTIRAA